LIKTDDILEHVKNDIKQRKMNAETLEISGGEVNNKAEQINNPSKSHLPPTVDNLNITKINEILEDNSDISIPPIINGLTTKDTRSFNSQQELAKAVIEGNGVRLVPDMNAFMVQGVSNKKYTVTLFPKESCQCPSTGTCYHILAAKLSIGIDMKPQQNERKLISLMRYKNRPKSQKRLGQKKQKPSDFENLIPAPDSKFMKLKNSNSEGSDNNVNDAPKSKLMTLASESDIHSEESDIHENDANSIVVSIKKK
jgi:hypothetical protein